MPAGTSAARRSRELAQQSDVLFELAEAKRQQSRQFARASAHERDLAAVLRHMGSMGWTVLEDRLWPGSRTANIDLLLVGPGGIVVLDAKSWAEVEVRDGSLFRGQVCADDDLEATASLVDAIADLLAPLGLVASVVRAALVFDRHSPDLAIGPVRLLGQAQVVSWLAGLPPRVSPDDIALIVSALDESCPEIAAEQPPSRFWRRSTTPRHRAATVPTEQPALVDVDALAAALLDHALAGPVEGWMSFVHPEQNKLVRTEWNGPARIRGPAGTGKTVVGLHRAVHLATRLPDPVLFVSYVRTLPVVLSGLARRISETAAENIEFVGVHALASRVLAEVGRPLRPSQRGADAAFGRAWHSSAAAAHLRGIDERPAYWREEVDHVIKGRGITDLTSYRELLRVGRRTRLRSEDREVVWELYRAYEDELGARGVSDFNDLLLAARDAVADFPDLARYGAVFVDEVQDLNLAALNFLTALAGPENPRLLLIGDGQQSVYPGGFRLAEAGISVAGRAAVLKHNYRNTKQILEVARALVSADAFDDLDDIPEAGSRELVVSREGPAPLTVEAASQRDLDAALESILFRIRAMGVRWGDVAVLCQRVRDAERYRRHLSDLDIPTIRLEDYDGETVDHVKVGTIKRAKGLEFAYVFLPGLDREPPATVDGESPEAHAERVSRWRRELYVGMTRARDRLWVGYLAR